MSNAEAVVSRKWGFEYYPVAGCVVSQELADSVEKVNKFAEDSLIARNGKDWHDRYSAERDQEYEREKKVADLLDKLPYIKTMQNKGFFYYELEPVSGTSAYWVDACDLKGIRYRFRVDYRTKKVARL